MDMDHRSIARRNMNIQEPEMVVFQYFVMAGFLAYRDLGLAKDIQ